MTKLQRSVLVVDDEFLIVLGLCSQVEEMGLTVCGTAATADAAVELAQRHRPAVVLMDMRLLGDKDGVDASGAIYETVGSKVIFITGSREPSTIERINSDHPFAILFKPISDEQLIMTIEAALDQANESIEATELPLA
ncbi:MAG: response regulator [Microvirga sp.]